LIIYLSADGKARRYLTPHSLGLRRRLTTTTNLSIGLMAHIASRTKCCEFVIRVRAFAPILRLVSVWPPASRWWCRD